MKKKDFFRERHRIKHTGSHLIIDLYDAEKLNDIEYMKRVFLKCVRKCKATLLNMHFHHFEPNGGLSGVAILAESHISVHTWPEYRYAAFDVFMCGDANTMKALDVIRGSFNPDKIIVNEILRGQAIFSLNK